MQKSIKKKVKITCCPTTERAITPIKPGKASVSEGTSMRKFLSPFCQKAR